MTVHFADEMGQEAPRRSREKLRALISRAPEMERRLIEVYELGHWDGERMGRWAANERTGIHND